MTSRDQTYGLLPAIVLLQVVSALALVAAPVTLYVSPTGNDAQPGTKDQPVATLEKAQALVRALKKQADGPVTVNLLPGTFYLSNSLVFGPEDSGTEAAPITWQAVEEGTVTISGGMRLECDWKPYQNGTFLCELPAAKAGKLKFSELYVNGRRQVRARFPNGDPRLPQPQGYIRTQGAKPEWQNPPQRPHTEMYYDPATFTQQEWAHPEDAVVFCFQRINFDGVPFWNGQWHVRGLDRSRNAILLGTGGHQQLLWHYMQAYRPGIYPNMPFYVENVFEELDAPGEWYLDPREGKLYYRPAADVDLKTAVVEPALLQRVIQFVGTKDQPVHHLTLRGVWIAHGASTYFEPYSTAGMGDYTIQRGGAVFLENAQDITVDRCSLEGNSGNGFYVNGHARRVKLTNSRVVDVGESGICFTGKDNYRPDKQYTCPRCGFVHWWGWDPLSEDDIPVDCEAVNNLVHDVGVFAKQCGGVFIANALRIRIAGNHIYNCPRAGINVNNGLYGGHVFENNDVHDTVRETSDHGPFNSYGRDYYWCQHVNHTGNVPEGYPPHQGDPRHDFGSFAEVAQSARETTVIRHNRFDGPRLDKTIGPGLQHPIDLDDGSSNYEIYENLGVGMSIKTFCSSYCKFHDNVFVQSYPLRLLQPFDGRLEIRDNHFVDDLTPAEAKARFLPGVRFGLTAAFPEWLRDPDRISIKPTAGPVYHGDLLTLEVASDESAEIRYTLDGSEPTLESPLYRKPIQLSSPVTLRTRAFRQGQPSSGIEIASFKQLLPRPDVFLDELPIARMKSGNENPEKKTQMRRNCIAKPLRLGGVTYERGIGDHAGNGFAAELVYALKPEYQRFVSLVGVDDQTGPRGSLRVKVYGDDQLLAETPILRGAQAPHYMDVKLPKGARQLRLEIDDAGDGYDYDDANFVNAGFVLDRPTGQQDSAKTSGTTRSQPAAGENPQPSRDRERALGPEQLRYDNAPPEAVAAWRQWKFGMHVQWNPSVLGGGEISWSRRGAGAMLHQGAGLDPTYDDYYKRFKAEKFNALELCRILKDAGMRFSTFCNKHHDGFCMWDTQLSDYKSTSPHCPAARDFTREWAEACRATGLKHVLYVSQPDWIDPDYLRNPEAHARYLKRLHGWVRELCTDYGTVDAIEFDGLGGLACNWDSENLFKMIRELQPNTIINSRCGAFDVEGWPAHVFLPQTVDGTSDLPFTRGYPGDFDTPESWSGEAEIQRMQTDRPWETCTPLQRGQWQYNADRPFMSASEVLQLLIHIVGLDGNLMLSVPIRSDGTFDERHVAELKEVGRWLRTHGETIYETRGGPYQPTSHGVATHRDNQVFLHLLRWPDDRLVLPPIQRKLVGSSVLTGGTAEVTQDASGAITVSVPKEHRQDIDTIVALTLDGPAHTAQPGRLALGSLATRKSVRASNVYSDQPHFAAENAVDDDVHTRWATDFGTRQAWLEVDLGAEKEFNAVLIKEDLGLIRKFEVQVQKKGQWVAAVTGDRIGGNYRTTFPAVKGRRVRLAILDAVAAPQFPTRLYGLNSHMAAFPGPTLWEFQVLAGQTWAELPPKPDVFLDELPMLRMQSGNEQPEKKTQMRLNCIAQPLRLDGVAYDRGIGDHAGNGFAAELVYPLKPEYRRFVSLVGIDDQTGGRGSIVVKVLVDGRLKVQTPVLRGGESPAPIDLKLPSGAKDLTLLIEDAGDGYGYDDANFVNAGFML